MSTDPTEQLARNPRILSASWHQATPAATGAFPSLGSRSHAGACVNKLPDHSFNRSGFNLIAAFSEVGDNWAAGRRAMARRPPSAPLPTGLPCGRLVRGGGHSAGRFDIIGRERC